MSEKIRRLKEDASRLIAKGKLAEAADEYVKIVKTDPRDLTARQKLAELYARLGRIPEAVHAYQSVAGSYAVDGLLLKAIAVCKIILQIDPSHTETQQILADLSTRRRGESNAVEMPKSMSTALAPGAKRNAHEIRGVPSSQLAPRTRDGSPAPERPITNVTARGPMPPPAIPLGATPQLHEVPEAPARRTDGAAALGRSAATDAASFTAGLAAAAARAAAAQETDDADVIEVSFDSGEGAPVVVVETLPAMPGDGAPIEVDIMGGMDVVMGVSASKEGPPLPPDEVAPDDAMMAALAGFSAAAGGEDNAPAYSAPESETPDIVDDDESGVIELTEPAHIDVDKVPPIPLFSDLPKDAFIALTERMELRVAGIDDVLVQEGAPGTSMFIIIQGRVIVKRRESEGDKDLVLAELTDGAFFGEMALLSDAPRMASVVCADDTMLFEISRELLADITREYPSVGEVMKKFHKNRLLTNLLKTSPIFQPFSTKDKKDLIEKFKSRAVDEGVYLITRERPGEGLYVVLSGRCEVFDVNDDGKEVLLAELKEGDVFGEMSMLWHKKTCASVKAVSPCVVLRLPRESFNEVIMTHPQILETLTALSERRQKHNAELKAPDVVTDFIV